MLTKKYWDYTMKSVLFNILYKKLKNKSWEIIIDERIRV